MSCLGYFAGNPYRENPYPPEQKPNPRCPNCGEELGADTKLVLDAKNEIVGCENCLHIGYTEDIYTEEDDEI